MNMYILVDTRANNFIPHNHKICYINKNNATEIQKIMKEEHNADLKLVEFEIADSLFLEMDEHININDNKYEWRKANESDKEPEESKDEPSLVI
tara:strand:- start:960 stop:1241 length:282 start_codon:yes stop_codon:yes gene_type:complete